LTELDANVEKEDRQWNRLLRQPDFSQSAGEAEAMEQSENEGYYPRSALGEAGSTRPTLQNL
jgi:hypothetical protein